MYCVEIRVDLFVGKSLQLDIGAATRCALWYIVGKAEARTICGGTDLVFG